MLMNEPRLFLFFSFPVSTLRFIVVCLGIGHGFVSTRSRLPFPLVSTRPAASCLPCNEAVPPFSWFAFICPILFTSRIACITRQLQIIALIGLSVHSSASSVAFSFLELSTFEPLVYQIARPSEPTLQLSRGEIVAFTC